MSHLSRLSAVVLALNVSFALAADAPGPATLTPEETTQLEEARTAAKRTPAVREATAKYAAARKAHLEERRKFPNDRRNEPTIAFRKAEKEYNALIRETILAKNPELKPLLDKAEKIENPPRRKMNEGETVADSDVAANPAIRPIKDEPGLPRVLLIGDSISIGYTLPVRARLKGKANVHRIPINGGATEIGLENMQEWLGDGRWDVIHFNFGLHDAKYQSETELRTTHDEYAANLRALVDQMQKTGAKLIFATTTPVPKGGVLSPGRKFDSIAQRNDVARRVMAEKNVAIDDLYSVALPVMDKVGRPNDVHFAPEGYELLADAVAKSIAEHLPAK